MPAPQPQILLTTVGTSLLGNLNRLPAEMPLGEAYKHRDAKTIAQRLVELDSTERTNGAELCSTASLIDKQYVPGNVGIYLFHSATDDGRLVASILEQVLKMRGHSPVETVEVEDLQDEDPKRFRTKGLRNLTKRLCEKVRSHGASTCAFNATGGYKAQIAIAVLLGQSLGIPTYYMHERFTEIIAFPPMPVALDFEIWMRATGLFQALEGNADPAPRSLFDEEWDERYESLIESVDIDGSEYLELSATGQIFHETFRERFRTQADQVLPPAALSGAKKAPGFKSNEAHLLAHRTELEPYLQRITDEVPQVIQCVTTYFNPDLPQRTRFRDSRGQVEGVYSNGSYTVRFQVITTAQTEGQRYAVVAALNEWLDKASPKS